MDAHCTAIGLTVGDPAGIGPEITVKCLREGGIYDRVKPVVYADRAILEQTLKTLALDMDLNPVANPAEGRYEPGCIDYIDCDVLRGPIAYGQISAEGGQAGYAYLERAIEDALAGSVVGLCTAPLNKESLQAAEVPFIDHTAVLKARAAHHDPMTLFMVRTLRIFFLTRHISFRQIPDAITREGLI